MLILYYLSNYFLTNPSILPVILSTHLSGKKPGIKKFLKIRSKAKLSEKQVVIRDRSFSSKKDFGLTISNRSGMLQNAEYSIMPLKEKMQHPCFYPSYTFFMDYNGDVLMCAHDWGKKRILGNLKEKSFL